VLKKKKARTDRGRVSRGEEKGGSEYKREKRECIGREKKIRVKKAKGTTGDFPKGRTSTDSAKFNEGNREMVRLTGRVEKSRNEVKEDLEEKVTATKPCTQKTPAETHPVNTLY